VRVEYRFDASLAAGKGNAGLMILMDNEALPTTTKTNRPRSIEVNCKRSGNDPWSLWAARDYGPYMTTTVKAGMQGKYPSAYEPGGVSTVAGITDNDPRTIVSLTANNEVKAGEWNHGEAWVYGDSGVFFLNGQLRTSSWHWVTRKGTVETRVAGGGVGLQAEENTPIWYRNFEIQELQPFPPFAPVTDGVRDRFSIRCPSPARTVLSLDGRGLAAMLRGAPGGEAFRFLQAYSPAGRLVASLSRSRADEVDMHGNAGSGPFLLRWSSRP
jgi:hypothetical protein